MTITADRTTFIGGSAGYLAIDTPWFSDGTIKLTTGRRPDDYHARTITVESPAHPYAHQADRFAATVDNAQPPVISKADSLGNAATLARLRAQIGLA